MGGGLRLGEDFTAAEMADFVPDPKPPLTHLELSMAGANPNPHPLDVRCLQIRLEMEMRAASKQNGAMKQKMAQLAEAQTEKLKRCLETKIACSSFLDAMYLVVCCL